MAEFWINHIAIRSHGCQQHQQRQQQQNWKIIFVLLGRRKRRCGNSLSWVDDIWLLIFSHIFGVFILLDRHNDGMLQKIFLSPDLIPPHNWSSTTQRLIKHKFDHKWCKHRWCAWDSKPGWKDGWHRWSHWAMAAPNFVLFKFWSYPDLVFNNFVYLLFAIFGLLQCGS